MKKLNVNVQVVGLIVAGLVATQSGYAEYGSSPSSSFSSDLSKVESILRPAGSSLGASKGGNPSAALQEDLQKKLKEVEKKLTTNKEEQDLRGKLNKWTKDADSVKTQRAMLDIALQSKLKERENESKNLQQFFSALNQPQGSISAADIDTGSLEPSCRSGVDFTQFKALADQMNSQPFQYLRDQGQQFLSQKDEELKQQKIQQLQKLAEHFDKLAAGDNNANDFQQDVSSGLRLGEGKDDQFALDKRLSGLRAANEKKKKEVGDLRKELVKGFFTDFLPTLSKLQENDGKILQLANFFADNLEQYRRATVESAVRGASKLRSNCEKNGEMLGRDNPLAPNTLFNSAYQWVVSYHKGDADFYANRQFLQGVQQISQNLRCTDVAGNMEDLFGGNLQVAINSIRNSRDPRTLLQGAMSTMQAIGAAQSQVGEALRPLMSDCQYAAKQVKNVKNFIGQVQQQVTSAGQQQDGSQGGSRRSASSRSTAANRGTTHNSSSGSNSGSFRR